MQSWNLSLRSIPPRKEMEHEIRVSGRERATQMIIREFADQAFSRAAGAALIDGNRIRLLTDARENYPAGDLTLRIVASVPATAGMLRVDQLVAALARKRLWLTDAYLCGNTLICTRVAMRGPGRRRRTAPGAERNRHPLP
jgi:hypothetical protein